jgi:histidinol-phosphate/aromatic aminotransferase/cobyric acid decarboxylase-like protein
MKIYAFPTSLRVTIGRHEENEIFLDALQRVMTSAVRAL